MYGNSGKEALNKKFESLTDLLTFRSEEDPQSLLYRMIDSSGDPEESYTYQRFHSESTCLARALVRHSKPSDRVLLLFPAGLEFPIAFFACLYAGLIGVPVAVPVAPREDSDVFRKLISIISETKPSIILSVSNISPKLTDLINKKIPSITKSWIFTDKITALDCSGELTFNAKSTDIAYLQFTSGSTSSPKGVVLTHKNVLTNLSCISNAVKSDKDSISVSWLPHYHDMGLVSGLLAPIHKGFHVIIIPPMNFLRWPLLWLKTISNFKATHGGGPNFGYDLCTKKVLRATHEIELDLSSWRVAFNGAEPIRNDTLDRFSKCFSRFGFQRKCFMTCYGMAESTVGISFSHIDKPPSVKRRIYSLQASDSYSYSDWDSSVHGYNHKDIFVSSGYPAIGQTVKIVDPDTGAERPNGEEGEIWVHGDSVGEGYWHREEESQSTFSAVAVDDSRKFLRTGDMGFVLDGEVYVSGRIKDVIVISGYNYHACDIESCLEKSHSAISQNGLAAVSYDIGGETKVAIFSEIDKSFIKSESHKEITTSIRKSLSSEFEIRPYLVVLLFPKSLPRTTSGKLRRSTLVKSYEHAQLKVVYEDRSAHPIDSKLDGPKRVQEEKSGHTVETLKTWLQGYSEKRINPLMMDDRKTITPHIVLDFGNQGLLGIQAPKALGGLGFNNFEFIQVLEQLGYIDQTLASFVGVHNVLGLRPVLRFGSESTKERFLRDLVSGRALGAFALTELGAGSNPKNIASKLQQQADEVTYILNGQKIWSGNAGWSSLINTFAYESSLEGSARGISAFAVPAEYPGVNIGPDAMTMGVKGMVQSAIDYSAVILKEEDRLGAAGEGMLVAQDAMMHARLAIAGAAIGSLKRCAVMMSSYSGSRTVSTGRLRAHPLTCFKISEVLAATNVIRGLVYSLSQALDAGIVVSCELYAIAKIVSSEELWKAIDDLMQISGGRGYIETNGIPQMLRDARIARIFEGPTETLKAFIGASALSDPGKIFSEINMQLNVGSDENYKDCVDLLRVKSKTLAERSNDSDFVELQNWTYQKVADVVMYQVLTLSSIKIADEHQRASAKNWLNRRLSEAKSELLRDRDDYGIWSFNESYLVDEVRNIRLDLGEGVFGSPVFDQASCPLFQKAVLDDTQASKIQERAEHVTKDIPVVDGGERPRRVTEDWIVNWIATRTSIERSKIGLDNNFNEFGMDSIDAVEFIEAIQTESHMTLNESIIWEFPSIRKLCAYLNSSIVTEEGAPKSEGWQSIEDIAENLMRTIADVD